MKRIILLCAISVWLFPSSSQASGCLRKQQNVMYCWVGPCYQEVFWYACTTPLQSSYDCANLSQVFCCGQSHNSAYTRPGCGALSAEGAEALLRPSSALHARVYVPTCTGGFAPLVHTPKP